MKYEVVCVSAILAAMIVGIYRVNQWSNRQWHLRGDVMRRKRADGSWETKPASESDKDDHWREQNG